MIRNQSSCLAAVCGLNDLGQNTTGCGRVQKGHSAVADTDPRLLIDQAQSSRLCRFECGIDVFNLVGDVVHSGTLFREELAHWRIGPKRLEQLDVAFADLKQDGLDSLLLDDFTMLNAHLKRPLVECKSGVDVLDCHADVVDPTKHEAEA